MQKCLDLALVDEKVDLHEWKGREKDPNKVVSMIRLALVIKYVMKDTALKALCGRNSRRTMHPSWQNGDER